MTNLNSYEFTLNHYIIKALPCILNAGQCQNNGECTNDNNGGFTCTCKNGFTGENCEIGKKTPIANRSFQKGPNIKNRSSFNFKMLQNKKLEIGIKILYLNLSNIKENARYFWIGTKFK